MTTTLHADSDYTGTEGAGSPATYSSLALATAAVSLGSDDYIIEVFGSAPHGAVTFSNTASDNALIVRGSSTEPDGRYDGDKYIDTAYVLIQDNTAFHICRYEGGNITIEGLQVDNNRNSNVDTGIYLLNGRNNGHVKARRCRVAMVHGSTTGAIQLYPGRNGSSFTFENNIVGECQGTGIKIVSANSFTVTNGYIVNNTISNVTTGIQTTTHSSSSGNVYIRNNVVSECTDDFLLSSTQYTHTVTHNASNDGDGTSAVTITTDTDEFTDPNNATLFNRDFTPKSGHSLGAGTTTDAPSIDIRGNARSGTYTIGAFQDGGGGGPTANYLNSKLLLLGVGI